MRTCKLFDKYKDGEVGADERRQFETHLAVCADCRAKLSLINNLAFVLQHDKALMPADLSARIAQKAFQNSNSWDALVVGWLRPRAALLTLVVVAVLFSFLWLVPNYRQSNAYSEYETLMNEVDASNLEKSISQIHSDNELVVWLQEEDKN
jgi:hypothetical protein